MHIMPLCNYEFSDNRLRSWDSVVSILPRVRVGWSMVWISAEARNCLFSKTSTPVPVSAQPPIKWLLRIKQPKHEADHSPPSSAKDKAGRSCFFPPHMPSWHVQGQPYLTFTVQWKIHFTEGHKWDFVRVCSVFQPSWMKPSAEDLHSRPKYMKLRLLWHDPICAYFNGTRKYFTLLWADFLHWISQISGNECRNYG